MTECIDCKLKDRDLEQARKDLALAQAQPSKRDGEHLRLSGAMARAKSGDCPDCKADLDTYNKEVIGKALDALTGEEAIGLAVKKGGLPEQIMVQLP